LVIPALFFVIPALSRDPLRTAVLGKGLWYALDPRVFARDDKRFMDVSTSSGLINKDLSLATFLS